MTVSMKFDRWRYYGTITHRMEHLLTVRWERTTTEGEKIVEVLKIEAKQKGMMPEIHRFGRKWKVGKNVSFNYEHDRVHSIHLCTHIQERGTISSFFYNYAIIESDRGKEIIVEATDYSHVPPAHKEAIELKVDDRVVFYKVDNVLVSHHNLQVYPYCAYYLAKSKEQGRRIETKKKEKRKLANLDAYREDMADRIFAARNQIDGDFQDVRSNSCKTNNNGSDGVMEKMGDLHELWIRNVPHGIHSGMSLEFMSFINLLSLNSLCSMMIEKEYDIEGEERDNKREKVDERREDDEERRESDRDDDRDDESSSGNGDEGEEIGIDATEQQRENEQERGQSLVVSLIHKHRHLRMLDLVSRMWQQIHPRTIQMVGYRNMVPDGRMMMYSPRRYFNLSPGFARRFMNNFQQGFIPTPRMIIIRNPSLLPNVSEDSQSVICYTSSSQAVGTPVMEFCICLELVDDNGEVNRNEKYSISTVARPNVYCFEVLGIFVRRMLYGLGPEYMPLVRIIGGTPLGFGRRFFVSVERITNEDDMIEWVAHPMDELDQL